eukprot:1189370-Prorocentrum_minimum.AAC.1
MIRAEVLSWAWAAPVIVTNRRQLPCNGGGSVWGGLKMRNRGGSGDRGGGLGRIWWMADGRGRVPLSGGWGRCAGPQCAGCVRPPPLREANGSASGHQQRVCDWEGARIRWRVSNNGASSNAARTLLPIRGSS